MISRMEIAFSIGARRTDLVRALFLQPILESVINVKGAFGEKAHDAHAPLSPVLFEKDRD